MEAKAKNANVKIVKVDELLGNIVKQNHALLGKMPEKKAVAIIRAALVQLAKQITAAKEGSVKVPALGNFQIRMVKQEKDGKTVRRTVFSEALPKAKAK